MNQISREELARELAKLVHLIKEDAVSGVFLVAVHDANESATVVIAPPSNKASIERLMGALDRSVFRAKVAMYLAPEGKQGGLVVPPVGRPQ